MADTSKSNRVVMHLQMETEDAKKQLDKFEKSRDDIQVDVNANTAPAETAMDKTAQRIQEILSETESSAVSKALHIGNIYKEQGQSASEAMKNGWVQVGSAATKAEAPVKQHGSLLQKIRSQMVSLTARTKSFGTQSKEAATSANTAFSTLSDTAKKLMTTMGIFFSIQQVVRWGQSCVSASTETENAFRGLSSILSGQGRSFSEAQKWIDGYISDGLVPLSNAVTAYKNLAARGYDDTQIQSVLTALKDSAAYGRQSSYSLGEAVETASEGLKNENSILVDNAGVTKNVAKMWDEYATSIGTTSNNLTQAQKIQAEVNGILTETRFQTGDAAKIAGTFSGSVSQLTANLNSLRTAVGSIITGAIAPYIQYVNAAVQATTSWVKALGEKLGFSMDISGTQQLAGGLSAASDNADSLTESLTSAKTAAEELKAASFDNFNVIGSKDSDSEAGNAGSTAAVTSSLGTAQILQEAQDTATQTKGIFERIFDGMGIDLTPLQNSLSRLQEAFSPIGEKMGSGLKWLYDNILVPVATWTIEDFLPAFLDTLSGCLYTLDAIIEALQPYGEWLWDKFISPLADWTGDIITTGLENLADVLTDISDWIRDNPDAAVKIGAVALAVGSLYAAANTGSLASAAGGISRFVASLLGMDVTIGVVILGIISWGYVITELSKNWEDICDVFEESGGAFGFISGWLEYVREDVEEFFNMGDFGAAWYGFWSGVGEFLYEAINGWSDTFTGFGEFLYDLIHEKIPAFFGFAWGSIVSVFADIGSWFAEKYVDIKNAFKNVPTWFGEKFKSAYTNVKNAFKSIATWFGDRWTAIKNVFAAVGSWFSEKFTTAYNNVKNAFANVSGTFESIRDKIKKPFENIAAWFKDTFTNAWNAVLNVFSAGGSVFEGIKDGISSVFKDTVNSLIDGINNVISEPFQKINDALNTIRGFSWSPVPGVNVTPFSFLPEISIPSIPRFAKGAVVSQPTLAMVGDNPNAKSDPEVISPLSKLKKLLPENGDSSERILQKLDRLIQLLQALLLAIQESDTGGQGWSDREIYNAAERGKRRVQRMKGGI